MLVQIGNSITFCSGTAKILSVFISLAYNLSSKNESAELCTLRRLALDQNGVEFHSLLGISGSIYFTLYDVVGNCVMLLAVCLNVIVIQST